MGKKLMFDELRRGRARHVAYTFDALAQQARDGFAVDGMLAIVSTSAGFEFYRAGVLLDRPNDAVAALLILLDRVKDQVETENVAPL